MLSTYEMFDQICFLQVYKQMENLDNMFLFSSLFQEKKLYQMENFHCLVHFNQLKLYTSIFVILAIIKSVSILNNFSKDCPMSYFGFIVIFVFFKSLANDNQNCNWLACKIWPFLENIFLSCSAFQCTTERIIKQIFIMCQALG